jgi:hypothetical protein
VESERGTGHRREVQEDRAERKMKRMTMKTMTKRKWMDI